MKSLACTECDFVAKGETAEEAVEKMGAHAMEAHAEKIAELSKTMKPEDMKAKMLSMVVDA